MKTVRWIFRGPDGIRAGWSILLFIAILAVPIATLHVVGTHFHLKPDGDLGLGFVYAEELVTVAMVLAATAIMGWIEKRSVWTYGLAGRRNLALLASGWLAGFLCLSALILVLDAGGYLAFDGVALHGLAIAGYGLLWLGAFFLAGLSEEMMYRGYLQATLARGIGFWPAAFLLSTLFAAAHLQNGGETAWGIASVLASGLILCLLLRTSGSLWLGIGFHGAWDWAESFLYGTPDSGLMVKGHLLISHALGNPGMSGGSAGPEGSALAGPMLLVGLVVLIVVGRRAGLFAHRHVAPSP